MLRMNPDEKEARPTPQGHRAFRRRGRLPGGHVCPQDQRLLQGYMVKSMGAQRKQQGRQQTDR